MTLRFPTEIEIKKRELISELLDESLVSIQLDPRREGVSVPEAYGNQPALCLNLSHAFQLDVFEIGRFGIEATLSFGGVRHHCVLPYAAIYSIECAALERHYFFPEDVPVELDIGRRSPGPGEVSDVPDKDADEDRVATDSVPDSRDVSAILASRHLRLIK